MKFSPLKKHPPHLKLCILFYRIYRKGPGLILHVCQYSFQNHVKSRKNIHIGYADIMYTP